MLPNQQAFGQKFGYAPVPTPEELAEMRRKTAEGAQANLAMDRLQNQQANQQALSQAPLPTAHWGGSALGGIGNIIQAHQAKKTGQKIAAQEPLLAQAQAAQQAFDQDRLLREEQNDQARQYQDFTETGLNNQRMLAQTFLQEEGRDRRAEAQRAALLERAQIAASRKGQGGGGHKGMSNKEFKEDIEKPIDYVITYSRLADNFEPHIGQIQGLPTGVLNKAIQMAGTEGLLDEFLGSNSEWTQQTKAAVRWWATLHHDIDLAMRHELFGSALTEPERRSYERARAIHPGMPAEDIRARLEDLRRTNEERAVRVINARLKKAGHTEGGPSVRNAIRSVVESGTDWTFDKDKMEYVNPRALTDEQRKEADRRFFSGEDYQEPGAITTQPAGLPQDEESKKQLQLLLQGMQELQGT